jgi:hypothetical protein
MICEVMLSFAVAILKDLVEVTVSDPLSIVL